MIEQLSQLLIEAVNQYRSNLKTKSAEIQLCK